MRLFSKDELVRMNFEWLKMLYPMFILGLFTTCLPNTESHDNAVEQFETEPKEVSLVDSMKIMHFKSNLKETFTIKPDTVVDSKLNNTNFSFFEGFTASDKRSSNSLTFQFFEYNSILKCEKAYQQFLDSLGDLQKIKPGKNMKYLKSPPIFMIQNKTSLIVLKYSCENNFDNQQLNELQLNLQQSFSNQQSEVLDIECGGPVNWL